MVQVLRIFLEVLGGASLILALILAIVHKPHIEIEAHDWNRPEPWHFACVWIRNKRPPRWIPFASRDPAPQCRVTARFHQRGAPATTSIPCRWSARPQPIRNEISGQMIGAQAPPTSIVGVLDPSLVPDSEVYDLHAGGRWEEVAVAVLRNGRASGWGAESYFHQWHHPDWKLDRGVYDVEVRAEWPGDSKTCWFRLEYLSDDLPSFRLQSATP